MKPQHKLDNQRALDALANVIHQWPGVNRRKLWRLHSELCRTSPGVQSSRAINRTGFVGVKRNKLEGYVAMASIRGRRIHVGTFAFPEEAYAARVRYMEKLRDQQRE